MEEKPKAKSAQVLKLISNHRKAAPITKLTLEQHGFELHGFPYMWTFSHKYLYCFQSPVESLRIWRADHALSICGFRYFLGVLELIPYIYQRDKLSFGEVRSYTWILNCRNKGVDTPKPHTVQGLTVLHISISQ